jgi:hypothetical protein
MSIRFPIISASLGPLLKSERIAVAPPITAAIAVRTGGKKAAPIATSPITPLAISSPSPPWMSFTSSGFLHFTLS